MKGVKVEEKEQLKGLSALFGMKIEKGDMFIVHERFKVDRIRNVAPIKNDFGKEFTFGDWGSVEEMGFLKVLEVRRYKGAATVEYTATNHRNKRSLPTKARFEVPLKQLSQMQKK
ncbi:MAG: hypothetical protein AAB378_00330 [Patescibacteria group bacterium]